MEIRNITTFLKIAELGSFTQAANSLGYAQSTITFQIKQLEHDLQHPLFKKSGRNVELTNFGKAYVPLATEMQNIVFKMQILGKKESDIAGTLKIGMVESLFFSNFLHLLPIYQKKFSKIMFDLTPCSSTELLDLLQKNKLDIICCLSEETHNPNINFVFSKTVPLTFVASNSVELSNKKKLSLREIAKEKFILTEENSIYHQSLLKLFVDENTPFQECSRVKSAWAIVNMLKYGRGISFLPLYAVKNEVKAGNLKILHTNISIPDIRVSVAVNKRTWLSPQIEAMLKLITTSKWL